MIRLEDITDEILSYNPDCNIDLLWKAYVYSAKVHSGQVRASGEPYLSHPIEVAYLLTKFKMDIVSVVVGLLHDTLEDTYSTEAEIEELFGKEVLFLVNGLTKISKIEFSSEEQTQAENYRKMILAMSKDIRVIVIKLCDRLHNMRTLHFIAPEKQKRIARETMDIYAPIAHRLGIGWVKQELEDSSFKFLYPNEFQEVKKGVDLHYDERMSYIKEVMNQLNLELDKNNIKADVDGRPKHFYSIFKKMQNRNISFENVYDLLGVRAISGSVKDCYSILGIIHSLWKPIPGKIKDYIAIPKANMYQSLHTTIMAPNGRSVEFQIRTMEMHTIAEDGIAAHWKYKEIKTKGESVTQEKPDERFGWLRQMLEMQSELKDPKEFIETMRLDLFPEEVYVFTPKGEVRAFPKGATPIDFAYSIHTDVGHRCVGAKVNGKIVPLRYNLRNGDFIEIMTSSTAHPKRDWLNIVKIPRARTKIKSFLREEQHLRSLALGREIVEKELKKHHLNPDDFLKSHVFTEVAKSLDFSSNEKLLEEIGFGKYSVKQLMKRLIPKEKYDEIKAKEKEKDSGAVTKSEKIQYEGVTVRGIDDILIRFAQCCSPVPGDPILGFISRGKGVTVHSEDCKNIKYLAYDTDRKIDVVWDTKKKNKHQVQIEVNTMNRPGMLGKISNAIAAKDINISQVMTVSGDNGETLITFSIEVSDLEELELVILSIEHLEDVYKVERVKGLHNLKKKTARGKIKH